MKRILVLVFVVAAAVMFVGCSHNSVNYSDGIGLETTFRPDSGNFGLTFRYGKILSAVLRENSEVEMTGEGSGSGSTGETLATGASSTGNVKVKIGNQITGYLLTRSPPEPQLTILQST